MILRGRQRSEVETSTTDQRLLRDQQATDWLHTDPWRVMRIQAEFIDGFGALAKIPKAITVLVPPESKRYPYYETGVKLGEAIHKAGYATITGGGWD